MQDSHGFLSKLCDLENLEKIKIVCEEIANNFPEITYFKDIHLNEPHILGALPNKLNNIISNLLKTDSFFLETAELHIQKTNCEPIPPHQDNFYHCNEYDKSLKILIPLQALNSFNGGLSFYDSPKNFPVLPHKPSRTKYFSSFIDKEEFLKINFKNTSYDYQPGDGSYHFVNNIHFSNGNKSKTKTMFLVLRYLTNNAKQNLDSLAQYKKCYEKHQEYLKENM